MDEMQSMKKEDPIYIFGSFKGYPKGNEFDMTKYHDETNEFVHKVMYMSLPKHNERKKMLEYAAQKSGFVYGYGNMDCGVFLRGYKNRKIFA